MVVVEEVGKGDVYVVVWSEKEVSWEGVLCCKGWYKEPVEVWSWCVELVGGTRY